VCYAMQGKKRGARTAAASAAARFLFVLSELPPLWVPVSRPALLCGPLFLSMLNYRAANCPRIAAPHCASVECPAALFYISAQPKPSIFGWLFITHLPLVINGELGQFALCHQHIMWLPCFCFPAVPHFNNRYLRVTCSTSRASTATSTAPSTGGFTSETAARNAGKRPLRNRFGSERLQIYNGCV
jgi:hypothetical protein